MVISKSRWNEHEHEQVLKLFIRLFNTGKRAKLIWTIESCIVKWRTSEFTYVDPTNRLSKFQLKVKNTLGKIFSWMKNIKTEFINCFSAAFLRSSVDFIRLRRTRGNEKCMENLTQKMWKIFLMHNLCVLWRNFINIFNFFLGLAIKFMMKIYFNEFKWKLFGQN